MKLFRTEDGAVVDTGITLGISLEDVCAAHGVTVADHKLVLESHELKVQIQDDIALEFLHEKSDKAKIKLLMSLQGKTSNALSGSLSILMEVMEKLGNANSLAEVRASVAPALRLMQQVAAMKASESVVSVQHVQMKGAADANAKAVIEGLEAMTKAARVIARRQEPQEEPEVHNG